MQRVENKDVKLTPIAAVGFCVSSTTGLNNQTDWTED